MAKKDIQEKAEKLKISKESLAIGLKKTPKQTEAMINAAYKYKFGGG